MSAILGLGIASGLLSAGGGIFSKFKHDEYADYLRSMNLQVPDSVYSAENIYRDMASKGLPGKDTIEADIQSQMARTMGLGKEVVDNPSALLDLLAKSSEGATANLRQLGVQDASAKMQNEAMLAQFLGSVKAPTELNVNQFNMQKDIAAKAEEMAGYKELLNGLSSGLSSAMTGVGYGNMQKYMKDKNKELEGWFDDAVNTNQVVSGSATKSPFPVNTNQVVSGRSASKMVDMNPVDDIQNYFGSQSQSMMPTSGQVPFEQTQMEYNTNPMYHKQQPTPMPFDMMKEEYVKKYLLGIK